LKTKDKPNKYLEYRKGFYKEVIHIYKTSNKTAGYRQIKDQINTTGNRYISEYMAYIIKCKDLKLPEIRKKRKNIGKYRTKENVNEEVFRYNNIAENIEINDINQVLTTDTTEYKLEIDGKQNVSFIADAYSGEILVKAIGKSLNNDFISYNLKLLKNVSYNLENIIIHSDRGGMYKSGIYHTKTADMNLIPSMSAPFTYTHNPWIETINGQFKDFIKFNKPKTLDELQIALNQFVYYNNNIKIKRKLKMTPIQYRCHHS
jgi:putative transposase